MDEQVIRAFNDLARVPILAHLAVFLSSPWMVIATLLPLAVWLLRKRRYLAIASIALAMSVGDAFNARLVKPWAARPRPCHTLQGLELPVRCGVGKSFASGHATVAFAFAVTAAPTVRYGWAIFLTLATLVASSRMVLGAHYPSDVAAGALFGALIGFLCSVGRARLERRGTPAERASAVEVPER